MNMTGTLNLEGKISHSFSPHRKRMRRGLRVVGALAVFILLNGCASAPISNGPESWQYDPFTGTPASGPFWGRF